jgi:hypothetical protein
MVIPSSFIDVKSLCPFPGDAAVGTSLACAAGGSALLDLDQTSERGHDEIMASESLGMTLAVAGS